MTNAFRAAVIVFPGSNCDRDMKVALTRSLGEEPVMVWHRDTDFPKVDLIALPGGFSYGDYLRCGAISARSPVMTEVRRRAEAGVRVIGVCNGFQVLCEAGLLPGVLMRNAGIRFICKDVPLRVDNADTPFSQGYRQGQVITLPVAHHDGNYQIDDDGLAELEDQGRILFRYANDAGDVNPQTNINGSRGNIAGIVNSQGNVLGMMPHPERLIDRALGGVDGRTLFDALAQG